MHTLPTYDDVVAAAAQLEGHAHRTPVMRSRTADVRIIVAINKVDAPNANIDRTRRQLYQLNLLPDNMGGDIQFVETSALTGQGIDDVEAQLVLIRVMHCGEHREHTDAVADEIRRVFRHHYAFAQAFIAELRQRLQHRRGCFLRLHIPGGGRRSG